MVKVIPPLIILSASVTVRSAPAASMTVPERNDNPAEIKLLAASYPNTVVELASNEPVLKV